MRVRQLSAARQPLPRALSEVVAGPEHVSSLALGSASLLAPEGQTWATPSLQGAPIRYSPLGREEDTTQQSRLNRRVGLNLFSRLCMMLGPLVNPCDPGNLVLWGLTGIKVFGTEPGTQQMPN